MSDKKIILKKLKGHSTIWHPDTSLVFKSKEEKIVIGVYDVDNDQISDLTDEAIELCDAWKFKIDESLFEEVDEEESVTAGSLADITPPMPPTNATEEEPIESEIPEEEPIESEIPEEEPIESEIPEEEPIEVIFSRDVKQDTDDIIRDVNTDTKNREIDTKIVIDILTELYNKIEKLERTVSTLQSDNTDLTKERQYLQTKFNNLKQILS